MLDARESLRAVWRRREAGRSWSFAGGARHQLLTSRQHHLGYGAVQLEYKGTVTVVTVDVEAESDGHDGFVGGHDEPWWIVVLR